MRIVKPNEVITKVATKDGECHVTISLDLNINISADDIKIAAQTEEIAKKEKEGEDFKWAIPEFGTQQKIKFGKEEKE